MARPFPILGIKQNIGRTFGLIGRQTSVIVVSDAACCAVGPGDYGYVEFWKCNGLILKIIKPMFGNGGA
ncbi:hypothetical protein TNCV_98101 [Trichonephila clavipes]|nr:hypothetical protein TNCV_98101 [Trichonephila clavipes]